MSITVTIRDDATARLRRLDRMHADIRPAIGAGVANFIKDWLFKLDSKPNKSGFPSQHFYSGAAKATTWRANAAAITVSVNKQGFRQRYQGGTIRPVNAKLLTIPARAEAAGHRAREFGNLKVQFGRRRNGSVGPVALVAGDGGATRKKFRGRDDTSEERPVKGADEGVVMYWLVPEVTQAGDESILPTTEMLQGEAIKIVNAEYERIMARQ
jgi:hypothetical protein